MLSPDDPRLDRLAALIAASPHSLVAAGERDAVRERHVAEGLAVAQAMGAFVTAGQRWMDLGTGGGLPGLVLALAFPDAAWVLVDAVRKKAEAVRGFADELRLNNVQVIAERVEVLARDPSLRGQTAGVVARAVAPLRSLVELGRGFVSDGGWLVAVKGPAWRAELAAARAAVERCGWSHPQGSRVPSAARPTWLVTMQAVGPPPPGVPRRVGVPQRRPL